jgi:hypothetical protein
MNALRRTLIVAAASLGLAVVLAGNASAQVPLDPNDLPALNDGGWVFDMAQLLMVAAIVMVTFFAIMYMRYAPRFAKDEEAFKVVQADRVRPGQELPRRVVDVSQAAPVVVAPPSLPSAEALPTAAPAPAPSAPPAADAAAPAAPAAEAPAPTAETTAPAAPAPAPAEDRPEVSLDEAVFEAKLQELLDAGTDRRIAEGKARRAAMLAARKKATDEA